jgi:proline dehydrogenase
MVSFDNTEIAFQNRSNVELQKTYLLFKLMSFSFLVRIGKHILNFATFFHLPFSKLLKYTIYQHFCGGESLEEAAETIKSLNKYNIKAILDYSVEGKENEAGFTNALNETLATIRFAASNPDVPFAVFKPSAFGKQEILEKASVGKVLSTVENNELNNFKQRIEILCKTASKLNIPIMIDAEHSYYQKIIDTVCEEMMKRYNTEQAIVYNTIQLYRTDRLDFLKNSLKKAEEKNYYLGIKFVRGAYLEKERERARRLKYKSPVHIGKAQTDSDFNEALHFSIEHIERISIFNGTHNEESSKYLTILMSQAGLPNNDKRIWFSQLYGMGDNISYNLANEGYNVAKYIPYGPVKYVMPYLIRRAEENTSVKGQSSQELTLIEREIKRRKNLKLK